MTTDRLDMIGLVLALALLFGGAAAGLLILFLEWVHHGEDDKDD